MLSADPTHYPLVLRAAAHLWVHRLAVTLAVLTSSHGVWRSGAARGRMATALRACVQGRAQAAPVGPARRSHAHPRVDKRCSALHTCAAPPPLPLPPLVLSTAARSAVVCRSAASSSQPTEPRPEKPPNRRITAKVGGSSGCCS